MVKSSTLTVPISVLIAIASMGGVGAAPAPAPSKTPVPVTVVTHHAHHHVHHRRPQTTIATPGTTSFVQAAPAAPAQGNFLSRLLRAIPIAGPITDSLLTRIWGIGGGGGLGLGLGGLDGLAGGLLKYHPQSASSANVTATASGNGGGGGGGLGGLSAIIGGTVNATSGLLGGLGLGLKDSEDIGEIAEKN